MSRLKESVIVEMVECGVGGGGGVASSIEPLGDIVGPSIQSPQWTNHFFPVSNQCPTTGVAKAMVCTILSMG